MREQLARERGREIGVKGDEDTIRSQREREGRRRTIAPPRVFQLILTLPITTEAVTLL
jgi:hypothetical protein